MLAIEKAVTCARDTFGTSGINFNLTRYATFKLRVDRKRTIVEKML